MRVHVCPPRSWNDVCVVYVLPTLFLIPLSTPVGCYARDVPVRMRFLRVAHNVALSVYNEEMSE